MIVIVNGSVDSQHTVQVQGTSSDEPKSESKKESIGSDVDKGPRGWRVTIDLSAPRTKAEQIFTRVCDRWKTDSAIDGVDLIVSEQSLS